jgi:hypothetical protein
MLGLGSKYQKFWSWFEAHEDDVFYFDRDREKIFDSLARQLRKVHRDLVFEFSGISGGKREFTISAGGIKSLFPEVISVVREAPALPRWRIIAFRQRQDVPEITFRDRTLRREDLYFDYTAAQDKLNIYVFIPGLAQASAEDITNLKTMGYLFLDTTLGEYDVETKIAGISFLDSSTFPERRRMPLNNLAGIVDMLPTTVH